MQMSQAQLQTWTTYIKEDHPKVLRTHMRKRGYNKEGELHDELGGTLEQFCAIPTESPRPQPQPGTKPQPLGITSPGAWHLKGDIDSDTNASEDVRNYQSLIRFLFRAAKLAHEKEMAAAQDDDDDDGEDGAAQA